MKMVLMAVILMSLSACANMPGLPFPKPTDAQKPPVGALDANSGGGIQTKGPKKRIAIMRFEVRATSTHGYRQLDLTAAEMLTTALFKTGEFIVVERSVLDKALKEQGLGLSGIVDASTAAKVGQVLGLQAIVTGSITHLGFETQKIGFGAFSSRRHKANAALDIRVIDASTAKILLADTGEGAHSKMGLTVEGSGASVEGDKLEFLGKALRASAKNVAEKIVAQMKSVEWTGRIADISGSKIYINAGGDLGLESGNRLKVLRPGKQIKDPSTGEIIGVEETRIGELLVNTVQERFSVASPKSGVGFKRNDMVRLVVDK